MRQHILREPVQWLSAISGLLLVVAPALPISDVQHGAVNAAILALGGFATALAVSGDKAAPLAAGLIKAIIAVALAWHLNFSPDAQAGVLVFLEAGVAFYLRTQVTAPVGPAVPVTLVPVAAGAPLAP